MSSPSNDAFADVGCCAWVAGYWLPPLPCVSACYWMSSIPCCGPENLFHWMGKETIAGSFAGCVGESGDLERLLQFFGEFRLEAACRMVSASPLLLLSV
ncbi:hypothetical protein Nepgr_012374 [Nepenthes gracilis]|uniref:Uncharacterized protein n=1 Tax=Nepenthes gracilis TaxID=150966 RepID=A0AAD3SFW3_NEPGR|nr:hypothetical protein Nepgr_012374 [Nepenthes gracilis]